MNQSQWKVLDAMGISSWQQKESGEIAAPVSLASKRAEVVETRYAIFVEEADLVAYRALFQSILNAVSWPVDSYRLYTQVSQLDGNPAASFKLIWSMGEFDIPELDIDSIQGPSLAELAANPKAKSDLWAQLKNYRHA